MNALRAILGTMASLLSVVWLSTRPAAAQPSAALGGEQSLARSEVLLGVVGLDAEATRSLVGVLQVEVRELGLTLVERPAAGKLAAWASEAVQSERSLLAILLDARGNQGWRLVVIDAARSRAIVRNLPGGIQQDAASIEAVVSIVVSAASALREGLEVASSPLEAVVGAPPPQTQPAHEGPSAAGSEPAARQAKERSFLVGSIAASVASFSSRPTTTTGVALALGLSWRARLEAHVFGTLFWPATIASPYGQFRVNRALLGATAGPVLRIGTLTIVPEAGVVAERLKRSETIPKMGILAVEGSALHRVGAVLALRLRLPLIRPLSAELSGAGAYFARRAQFSTTGLNGSLAEVSSFVFFTQLGLAVATE